MNRKTALQHLIWQEENLQYSRPNAHRPKVLAKYKRELADIERKEEQKNKPIK